MQSFRSRRADGCTESIHLSAPLPSQWYAYDPAFYLGIPVRGECSLQNPIAISLVYQDQVSEKE
jgi:hypothetical protein